MYDEINIVIVHLIYLLQKINIADLFKIEI